MIAIGRRRQFLPTSTFPTIDWNHPLAKGLGFYAIGPYEVTKRSLGTINGSLAPTASPQGKAWKAGGVTADYVQWGPGIAPTTGFTTYSAALFGLCPAAATDTRFGQWTDNSNHQSWLLQLSTAPKVFVSATQTYPNVAAGTLTAGTWNLMSTSRSGTTQTIYLNGKSAGSGTLAAPDTIANIEIQTVNSPDSTAAGAVLWCAWWNRALSAKEHALLYTAPYDFLRY